MKVVLIYLPHPYLVQPDAQAPLGLMYLAAVLQDHRVDVQIRNYSSFSVADAIVDLPPADVYGITITSMELPQANRFSKQIKRKYPESTIFLGGPGTYTDELVNWDYVDSICKGEAEITIIDMLLALRQYRLVRIYHGRPVEDLDSIPFPSRHLLSDNLGGNIFAYGKQYNKGGSTVITSSRGCPYKCAFCSAPQLASGQVRYRSVEDVCSEISHVKEKYGITQFRFSDDMFTANRQRLFDLCDELGKLDIVWRISTRTKPFDLEMAKVLYDSGCKEVSFGVESFDDNVLSFLNKGTTALDNVKALVACNYVGVVTRVLFMIRTPGQTPQTIEKNIEYLSWVPYNIIACTTYVPLPGSDVWSNPDKYNIEILDRNLDHYNFYLFNASGETEIRDVIKIKDRSLEEFNEESKRFRDYVLSTGKFNKG